VLTTVTRRKHLLAGAVALAAVGAATFGGLGAARARAGKPRVLGLYLPATVSGGAAQRNLLGEKIAKSLEKVAGSSVGVRNFGSAAEFKQAYDKGDLDFAVVESPFAAMNKMRAVAVSLIGRNGGQSFHRWAAAGATGGALAQIKGKKISIPRLGIDELQFFRNVLCDGDEVAKGLPLKIASDSDSAVLQVPAQAEILAVPETAMEKTKLKRIYTSGQVLNPVLVVRGEGLVDADMVAALERDKPGFDGWRVVEQSALDALRNRILSGPPKKQPVVAEPERVRLETLGPVNVETIRYGAPSLTVYLETSNEQPD
jgi:hypothetical protein